MSLSTSSSNDRIPDINYKKLVLAVVVLVSILSVAVELFYRKIGRPLAVTNNESLWAMFMDQVGAYPDKKDIVFLGASRIKTGISPKFINEKYPEYHAVSLGIGGTGSMATLDDLAEAQRVNGIVVCSVCPVYLSPKVIDRQKSWVDFYHHYHSNINLRVNQRLKHFLQSRLIFTGKFATPLFNLLKAGAVISGSYNKESEALRTLPDRQEAYVAEGVLKERIVQLKDEKAATDLRVLCKPFAFDDFSDFEAVVLNRLKPAVLKLQSQGVEVIILRMPESGKYWQQSLEYFPEWQCWDFIKQNIPARCIHFKEYQGLRGFECWDGSHLDYHDSILFTEALMGLIMSDDNGHAVEADN